MSRASGRAGRRALARLVGGALVTATLAVVPAPVLAEEPDGFLRLCRRADLLGLWRVLRFGLATGAGVDRADPAFEAHQRYVFHGNATMAYAASATPFERADQQAFAAAPAAITWSLDEQGRLLRLRESAGETRVETSECMVLTRSVQDPRSAVPTRPGDVLLTDLGPDERPTVRRLLRKVSASD